MDMAHALHEHDLMLADPPGDDSPWPKCETCGTDLDSEAPDNPWCSLDCAHEAGKKGERAVWQVRIARLTELAAQLQDAIIDKPQAAHDLIKRIDRMTDASLRTTDETILQRLAAMRFDLGTTLYPHAVGGAHYPIVHLCGWLDIYTQEANRGLDPLPPAD